MAALDLASFARFVSPSHRNNDPVLLVKQTIMRDSGLTAAPLPSAHLTHILFVGNSWQGSNARSLREQLAQLDRTVVGDIGDDHFIPGYRTLALRLANRVLFRLQSRELSMTIRRAIAGMLPDAVIVYKGHGVDAGLIDEIRNSGIPVVNVFPDYSPHRFGKQMRVAMGRYDLVISTKPFHPPLWKSLYGYDNRCVFVPHGYDPALHYCPVPAESHSYDVVLCAMWRPEYHRWATALATELNDPSISVAIAGPLWEDHRRHFPEHWRILPAQTGTAYREFVRSGRIAIAPINRDVIIHKERQPGDEDTARSYELAAAHCFFVHQRSSFITSVYDEHTEVPMWSNASELAHLIRTWLPRESARRDMALRAHTRAVPAYSIAHRAAEVLAHVRSLITKTQA
jgi:hypothetical protein